MSVNNMKVAYLIIAYKNIEQSSFLIDTMWGDYFVKIFSFAINKKVLEYLRLKCGERDDSK